MFYVIYPDKADEEYISQLTKIDQMHTVCSDYAEGKAKFIN